MISMLIFEVFGRKSRRENYGVSKEMLSKNFPNSRFCFGNNLVISYQI